MYNKCTVYGQKTYFTILYVQKNVQLKANVRFNGISAVSQCSQRKYLFWYKQMSLVILFVLILPHHSTLLEVTKFYLDHTGFDFEQTVSRDCIPTW